MNEKLVHERQLRDSLSFSRARLADAHQLLDWIIRNLLTESQLSVIPPGWDQPLRKLGRKSRDRSGY